MLANSFVKRDLTEACDDVVRQAIARGRPDLVFTLLPQLHYIIIVTGCLLRMTLWSKSLKCSR